MTQRELPSEIVKALEIAINNYLNKSIIYSPFRLFYNLFKKSNPKLINQIRERVAYDAMERLNTIDNFDPAIFISENTIHPAGKSLLQNCYGIGITLLKKKLTVMTAFKVIKNSALRNEVYEYILNEIRKAAIRVLSKRLAGEAEEAAQNIAS